VFGCSGIVLVVVLVLGSSVGAVRVFAHPGVRMDGCLPRRAQRFRGSGIVLVVVVELER
jgi:hypothetical protein